MVKTTNKTKKSFNRDEGDTGDENLKGFWFTLESLQPPKKL
jgi:hypothetical protein